MANQEHLDILKQGVEVWNQWRRQNPKIQPNFRSADLSHTNLEGAFLLEGGYFDADSAYEPLGRRADWDIAVFNGADLKDADLMYANLRRADVSFADFTRTDLSVE